ncbi:MAG: dolichyl-phosphate mannose synthase [Planctomycetaceae bacterium]|nr:dolichyl-phosphate mannose synthase [Planctomycetaceae bacterium]
MSPRVLTALPVFNEADHVAEVLDHVRQHCDEILVVDDGSSDGTADILAQQEEIHVVTHDNNTGYGGALRTAFQYSIDHGYDVLVTIDCDGQHQPQLIPELASRIYPEVGEPVDIVSGSRYLSEFDGDSIPPEDRRRINMKITQELNERLGLGITDSFCGFKAYRTVALENLGVTELGYAMPIPVWVQIARLGLKVVEYPVPLVYLDEERSFGGSLDDANRRLAHYMDVLNREIAVPC